VERIVFAVERGACSSIDTAAAATLCYSGQEVLPNDTLRNSLTITCSLHHDFICRNPRS